MEDSSELDDIRRGMTDAQWEIYQKATTGYGEQSESGIDISLLRENLKLTPTQRIEKMRRALSFVREVRCAGIAAGLSTPNPRYRITEAACSLDALRNAVECTNRRNLI
jgi:hypothetical protein